MSNSCSNDPFRIIKEHYPCEELNVPRMKVFVSKEQIPYLPNGEVDWDQINKDGWVQLPSEHPSLNAGFKFKIDLTK